MYKYKYKSGQTISEMFIIFYRETGQIQELCLLIPVSVTGSLVHLSELLD